MPSRHRILGVDDNPRNLNILRKSFGDEFVFVAATSGEEALETARRIRPAVVLLDIMMPGIDGYETCRRMRADPLLGPKIKIIMVSAKATTSERLEGYAAGADDYLVKPFDVDELLAKVRVYVRLKSVEEVDALKSNFLTLLGHETRTPLTLILSPLALLLEESTASSRHRELIVTIEAGARRLQHLIDRVLFLNQLKMGEVPFRMETVDLGSVAGAAAERMAEAAGKAGVHLLVRKDAPAPVFGDPAHLRQIIESLLDNAIRFSPRGETVTLRTGSEESSSVLYVLDRGPGVHPEGRSILFQECSVSDIDHHSQGLGMSLATSRLIAEQHGGMLTLEAEPDGGTGATFRLELPAAMAGQPASPPAMA